MIVERTHYYAKPGQADRVREIRRMACQVRVSIGLPAGAIFTNWASDDNDRPDVVWECAFPDKSSHVADLAARAASAEFTKVRETMRAQIVHFTRHILERDRHPLSNGMRACALDNHAIVPREITFSAGALDLKGYLNLPPGQGPFPCMIVNHGSSVDQGSLDVSQPATAALLNSWGIATFLPHRHGYGNSPGTSWRDDVGLPPENPDYPERLNARLLRESGDVVAAAECLRAMADIRADHIGVMGVSFGGVNTLLAAANCAYFTCAVEFAGAAMNWDWNPTLRASMTTAAHKLRVPIFFIQAGNDYSIRPTQQLAASLAGSNHVVWSKIYPGFGCNPMEGHQFGHRGSMIWGDDVKKFLELYL